MQDALPAPVGADAGGDASTADAPAPLAAVPLVRHEADGTPPPPVPPSPPDAVPEPAPTGPAPLDPVAAGVMTGEAAAPPGLLYYAVYLPAPSGQPVGPPIYLPAHAGVGALPPQPLPMMAAPAAAPSASAPTPTAPTPTALPPSQSEAARHNQKLLVNGIIAGVFVVHLPWLVYLFAVHACWGTFLESCSSLPAEDLSDPFADTGAPMLFARVVYLMLRVQAVLAQDWGQFSQAMQVSTGAGSFILTRIVAANGLVAEGRLRVWSLAASCALAFGLLFWAELHLLSDHSYPELGAQTVLAYIDQNLPVDFLAYSSVEASLKGYLQFLRLADALILGAALAMPTTRKTP